MSINTADDKQSLRTCSPHAVNREKAISSAMAGPEFIGAIFGLADVSFRTFISIQETASQWKHAPKKVDNINEEASLLMKTVSQLSELLKNNDSTFHLAESIGLSKTVQQCEANCATLVPYVSKWATSVSSFFFRARVHYLFHQSLFADILADIQVVKQNLILFSLLAQL